MRLSPAVELCLIALHLPAPDADKVRACFSRYSKPTTLPQKARLAIYMIGQAVLSLFNCSDWQKTQKLVGSHYAATLACNSTFREEIKRLPDRLQIKAINTSLDAMSKIGTELLSQCLDIHLKQIGPDRALSSNILDLDLNVQIERITQTVRQIASA